MALKPPESEIQGIKAFLATQSAIGIILNTNASESNEVIPPAVAAIKENLETPALLQLLANLFKHPEMDSIKQALLRAETVTLVSAEIIEQTLPSVIATCRKLQAENLPTQVILDSIAAIYSDGHIIEAVRAALLENDNNA